MEIKVDKPENFTKPQTFLKIRRKITKSKVSLFIIMVLIIGIIAISSFFYGAYMYYTGRYYHIRMLGYRLLQGDISFVKNSFISNLNEVDKFEFDIKFKDFEKLRYNREKALIKNYLSNDLQEDIPATIRFNNNVYKVSISLTGQISEHFRHPEKWSIAVKVKGENTIKGMKEFALLVPLSRGYLTDWIAYKMLESRNSIGARNDFIDVTFNGKNLGIFFLEERYDKLLLENSRFREGIIFKIESNNLKIYNEKRLRSDPNNEKQLEDLLKMWQAFLDGEINSADIFDIKKLASVAAVSDLMNQKHPLYFSNMRFYFNPVTYLVEPLAREWGVLTKESRVPFESLLPEDPNTKGASLYHKGLYENEIFNKIYLNRSFFEYYAKEADKVSNKDFLDSILNSNQDEYQSLLDKIYIENPFYEFPRDILYRNQLLIKKKLHPIESFLTAYIDKISNDSIRIRVFSKTEFPVQIRSIRNQKTDRKYFLAQNGYIEQSHISKSEYNDFYFEINNDNNEQSISNFEIKYSMAGLEEIRTIHVLMNFRDNSDISFNPMRRKFNIFEISNVIINNNEIVFPAGDYCFKESIYIPNGYSVIFEPGCNLDLKDSAKIVSYSPLFSIGTKDIPVQITSSDSTGQGIIVLNAERYSELNNVRFSNLSNISDSGYKTTASVTFYESPVNINYCFFDNNILGDDYLNVVRSEFSISNSSFRNTNADAFDSDFSKGLIENSSFINTGNDAIDVSGTKVKVKDVLIKNASDKGLSSGERSEMIAENVTIEQSEIAVCSKDKSTIEAFGLNISDCSIGICAFQKKPEYGPGVINVKNITEKNNKVPYLIEVNSKLTIEDRVIVTNNKEVREMLYGVIYGKASK